MRRREGTAQDRWYRGQRQGDVLGGCAARPVNMPAGADQLSAGMCFSRSVVATRWSYGAQYYSKRKRGAIECLLSSAYRFSHEPA
jgi:hypothetical protein